MMKASRIASCRPPPGSKEEGPVSAPRCRAWGTTENHEPLTEVSAASVGQSRHMAAPVFPANKAEATPAEHPLLAACTCMTTPEPPCPTCARWQSHYRTVTARHAAAIAEAEKYSGTSVEGKAT